MKPTFTINCKPLSFGEARGRFQRRLQRVSETNWQGYRVNQGHGRIPPKCTLIKFDMGNGAKGIPPYPRSLRIPRLFVCPKGAQIVTFCDRKETSLKVSFRSQPRNRPQGISGQQHVATSCMCSTPTIENIVSRVLSWAYIVGRIRPRLAGQNHPPIELGLMNLGSSAFW